MSSPHTGARQMSQIERKVRWTWEDTSSDATNSASCDQACVQRCGSSCGRCTMPTSPPGPLARATLGQRCCDLNHLLTPASVLPIVLGYCDGPTGFRDGS